MIRNHIVVAVRILLRHKIHSLINILGLAIGIACCVLILLFVRSELGYDRYHEKSDRIYRVIRETRPREGSVRYSAGTSGALAPALRSDFPEVEQTVRITRLWYWVRYGDQVFQQRLCLADASILEVFDLQFIKGDPMTVLRDPYTIVFTEETARKYFGDEDPMGRIVTVEGRYIGGDYRITGVVQNMPTKSSLQFDFISSTVTNYHFWHSWDPESGWRPVETYVLLPEGYASGKLVAKLPDLMARYMPEVSTYSFYHLQPLRRIHLYTRIDYGVLEPPHYVPGDIRIIYVLLLAGFSILLIACINFMNLATARSTDRAREVGLRKVVGAYRLQLICQFLAESVFQVFLSLLLALGFVQLALPRFNAFVEKELALSISSDISGTLALLGTVLAVGLLAGSYPAFYLSAFQPVEVLKGTPKTGLESTWFRKGLVVFQFAATIFLIFGTVVVFRQMDFIRNKDLGFTREPIVLLPLFATERAVKGRYEGDLSKRYNAVKQAFLQHPNVLKAAASMSAMGHGGLEEVVHPEGSIGDDWRMRVFAVDEDFLDVYGIPLSEGRNFSVALTSDATDAFILNETAVQQLGWENAIGKRLGWRDREGTVIGVVRDFHSRSLHEPISPTVFCMWGSKLLWLSLSIRPENIQETLGFLETKWKQYIPSRPFEFRFKDDILESAYDEEKRFSQIVGVSSLLAIFVACLGLFGLASFAVEQRTKEIGVRKVLGATVLNIVLLLSKGFVRLILIAFLIAAPLSYYAMNRWLEDFAYRINIGYLPFALAGGMALFTALVAVNWQALKAAKTNPVDALRYE